jgi:predicted anti-sigma-YlaC factor YlaD
MSARPEEDPWLRLARQARQGTGVSAETRSPDPQEIRHQVRGLRAKVRDLLLRMLWRRWALLAVAAALLAYGILYFVLPHGDAEKRPAISLPLPP